jgi:hypothetical protein
MNSADRKRALETVVKLIEDARAVHDPALLDVSRLCDAMRILVDTVEQLVREDALRLTALESFHRDAVLPERAACAAICDAIGRSCEVVFDKDGARVAKLIGDTIRARR